MTPQDAQFLLDWLLSNGFYGDSGTINSVLRIRRELAALAAAPDPRPVMPCRDCGGEWLPSHECQNENPPETVAETKAAMLAKLDASWPEAPDTFTDKHHIDVATGCVPCECPLCYDDGGPSTR